MQDRAALSTMPVLAPPEVLIFFRLPKTGGNTMDGVFEHCMPGQYFHAHVGPTESALLVRPTERIAEKYHSLPADAQQAVRVLIGIHVSMDVDRIFDRPSKFFTIVREPVDRAISNFYHNRTEPHLTSYPYIKDLTLEQYIDSGIGLDAHNHQVRLLSGCAELDAPWDPAGGPIVAPPVEPRHLAIAKRNIEERFIVAAPLPQFNELVWFFKCLYGWPLHRLLFNRRNEDAGRKSAADDGRPKLGQVSAATRARLAELNRYDTDLYEWVRDRFAAQLAPLQPQFGRDMRRFERLNSFAQKAYRVAPDRVRAAASQLIFPQRAA